MVGIRISIVTMVESMVSMVAKEKSSFSSRLSISRPLTIVSMVQSMVSMMAISIGAIMVSSFSTGISLSLASNGSKQTEGNHSNGSHHVECL